MVCWLCCRKRNLFLQAVFLMKAANNKIITKRSICINIYSVSWPSSQNESLILETITLEIINILLNVKDINILEFQSNYNMTNNRLLQVVIYSHLMVMLLCWIFIIGLVQLAKVNESFILHICTGRSLPNTFSICIYSFNMQRDVRG